jgi:4-hydroxybenzoate polyprenyltransferase
MSALIESLRPRQWTKNLIVFAGVIFARKLGDWESVLLSFVAFAIFCFLSSSTYLINDLADAPRDREHPSKRHRPIASGRLAPSAAWGAAGALVLLSGALALSLDRIGPARGGINLVFLLIALGYYLLNLAYSFALKHVVIVDVFCVAVGFVLRAAAGAVAIRVEISDWLLVCTILLALFIALSKRRHELVLLEEGAGGHRRSLSEYSPYLLDQMIAVVTASTVMAYALYTMNAETVQKVGSSHLVYSVPFVLFGIFRYLFLVHRRQEGGSPERVLVSDPPFIVNILLWLAAIGIVLYWRH